MLFLKVLSCMVICFGIVQSICPQNELLEKVLQSNMSNSEKLEEVNRIVLNQHPPEENSDENLLNHQIQTAPTLDPVIRPLPDTPTSELWDPWANIKQSKNSNSYSRRKPLVMWNPWSNIQIRRNDPEPTGYQSPSWNPSGLEESPSNSYQNSYRSSYINPDQINSDRLSLLNLQNRIYNNDRSMPYYGAHQTGMESPGLYPSYSDQFQSPTGNEPSGLENYPFKYNVPRSLYA